MAYQVLALKYRPRTFDEVVGQRAVVQTLKNSLLHNRIAHAYLFSGVRGVGKTTLARLLAKSLNCEKGPTATPCNTCPACTEIAASASLDVLEIDGASNNSVDDVRELRETVRYSPNRDRYRIFIIDEVHMLSNSAFNALLKTLEEPPPHAVFIFATTEYRKIPVTILSRCQHFEFKRIPRSEITAHLSRICAEEKVTASAHALDLIARLADGSLRDSQSLLDQVIAYAGGTVKDEDARAVLGILDREILLSFVARVADGDAAGLIGLIDQVMESGHDPSLFLHHLTERVRDLLLVKILPDSGAGLGLAEDDIAALSGMKERFSKEDLLRILDALAREEPRLKYSPQPRYLLEALAVRLCHLGRLAPLEELIAGLSGGGAEGTNPEPDRGRGTPPARTAGRAAPAGAGDAFPLMTGASDAPIPETPESPSVPQAARPDSSAAGPERSDPASPPERGGDPPDVRAQVEEILERIHQQRSTLYGFLSHASFFNLTGDAFVIQLPEDKAIFRSSLERRDYQTLIRAAVEAVTGRRLEVRVESAAPLPAEAAGFAIATDEEEERRRRRLAAAKDSPVVQSFLSLFPGEITDIEEG